MIKEIDKGLEDAAKALARIGRLGFSCKGMKRGTRSNEIYNDDRKLIERNRVRRSAVDRRSPWPYSCKLAKRIERRLRGERRSRFYQIPSSLL